MRREIVTDAAQRPTNLKIASQDVSDVGQQAKSLSVSQRKTPAESALSLTRMPASPVTRPPGLSGAGCLGNSCNQRPPGFSCRSFFLRGRRNDSISPGGALFSLRALLSLRAPLTRRALFALRAPLTLRALCALRSGRARRSRFALLALEATRKQKRRDERHDQRQIPHTFSPPAATCSMLTSTPLNPTTTPPQGQAVKEIWP